jgi:hypothetical protein
MVSLINRVQESLCNQYFNLTFNAGKVAHSGTMPNTPPVVVPTLREMMEHRHNGQMADEALPLRRPHIDPHSVTADT